MVFSPKAHITSLTQCGMQLLIFYAILVYDHSSTSAFLNSWKVSRFCILRHLSRPGMTWSRWFNSGLRAGFSMHAILNVCVYHISSMGPRMMHWNGMLVPKKRPAWSFKISTYLAVVKEPYSITTNSVYWSSTQRTLLESIHVHTVRPSCAKQHFIVYYI